MLDSGQTEEEVLGSDRSPSAPRRSMAFLVGSLAGGNLAAMALRMIGGLLIARAVAPATLGLFNGIGLVLQYVPFLQVGILNGLNRELPYFVGKGDRRRAEELAAAAQAFALALGGAVAVALMGIAGWYLARGRAWEAAGWLANGILGFFLFYSTTYLQTTFRTSQDFARLALVNALESGFALVLVALVALLNFYGLCLRAVLVAILSAAMLHHWCPVKVRPTWGWSHLKHLLKVGAPIFVAGQIYAYWTVIDSTLVLRFTGTTGMGLYAVVLLATSAPQLLPSAVSQVVYPRMAEQYGRTNNLDELLKIVRKPIILSAIGLLPVIAIAEVVVRPAVQWLLPEYVGAVSAMRWALLLPFVGSYQPAAMVFTVTRRLDLYTAAVVTGMAAYAGSLAWLIHDEVSLAAFPQAMLIGRAVLMGMYYLLIRYLRYKRRTAPRV
jgi:O-antigen/teichoic acid export membrane protein